MRLWIVNDYQWVMFYSLLVCPGAGLGVDRPRMSLLIAFLFHVKQVWSELAFCGVLYIGGANLCSVVDRILCGNSIFVV